MQLIGTCTCKKVTKDGKTTSVCTKQGNSTWSASSCPSAAQIGTGVRTCTCTTVNGVTSCTKDDDATWRGSSCTDSLVQAPGDCTCKTTKSGIKICTEEGNDSWAGESCP